MMNELMKRLQQWADEGRYDWQSNRFKTPHGILNYEELVFMVGNSLDFIKKDCRLRHRQMEKILLVLDDTIKVWRPIEHYPLKEDGEPILLWKKDIRNVILVAWSLEFGSCFTDCEWRDFRSQVIIENIKEYTHWQPLPQFIHEEKETNNV